MASKVTLEKDIEVTSSSPDDPRLKKRWGYVAALPSEYLIHFRKGQLDEKNSGQGSSCFKWWRDTTFIIPTSLKEIIFEANQLTKDNVDVKIRGMAVYRISDPLKIYKLINFSHRQSAEEKLARMIGDMCRSTSKWLVSNMNVEECIRKRKEDIAEALKKETSYVVTNEQNGWGVEIVTIDIQDVYIQDEEIFHAMQMLFKSEKMRESRLAEMELQRNLELKKLEQERELAEHRKNTELEKTRIEAEIREQRIEMEKQGEVKILAMERELAEHRKNNELENVRMEAEIKTQQMNTAKNEEVQKLSTERELAEHRKGNELEKTRIEAEIQAQRMEMQKDGEVKKLATERELAEHRKENELDRAQKEAEIKAKQLELTRHHEEKQFEVDRYRVEQNEAIANYKQEQQAERERQKMVLDLDRAKKDVDAKTLIHQEAADALRKKIEAENTASPVILEKHFTEHALPAMAEAMAKSLRDVKINILQQGEQGGVTPFYLIFNEVMDLFRERMSAFHQKDHAQDSAEKSKQ
jgi:hypothetical protein